MKKHLSKRRVVVSALIAVLLAIASGVAYAYWTSTGNGTSIATTAATASPLDVAVTLAGGIHPDGTAAINGTVTNSTTSVLQVNQVVGATVPVTVDPADLTHSACAVADFHVGALTLAGTSPHSLAAGSGSVAFSGSLSMDNTTVDQNACQGAHLILHLVAS